MIHYVFMSIDLKNVCLYVSAGPTNDRQRAVVGAFKHAWTAYSNYAWGHDHLKPISQKAHDWFGLGLTLVDSLDTMYIMNLMEGGWWDS